MPTYRNLIVNAKDFNGDPLVDFKVTISHSSSNYAPDGTFFPKREETFTTGTTGILAIPIWCNAEGSLRTDYKISFENKQNFTCVVPLGTEDISLGVLQSSSAVPEADYVLITDFVIAELESQGLLSNSPATPLTFGTVKLNSVSPNPIVYTKSEVDTAIAGATGADLSNYYTQPQVNSLLSAKADQATTFTKTEVTNLIPTDFYSQSQVNSLLSAKANQASTFTKTEVTNLLPTDFYSQSQVNSLLSTKANQATTFTKTEVTNLIPTDFYSQSQVNSLLSAKADQSSFFSHASNISNPHSVTALQVGAIPNSQLATLAKLDQAQTFSAIQRYSSTNLTFSANLVINLSQGNIFTLILTGNIASLSFNNLPSSPTSFMINFVQDSTGGRTVSGVTGVLHKGGVLPSLTNTSPNTVSVYALYFNGQSLMGSLLENYS